MHPNNKTPILIVLRLFLTVTFLALGIMYLIIKLYQML